MQVNVSMCELLAEHRQKDRTAVTAV